MFREYIFHIRQLPDLCRYTIVDSDFEAYGTHPEEHSVVRRVHMVEAVIETYEQRKLNVAGNLALAISQFMIDFPSISLDEIVEFNKEAGNKFAKYEDEVRKYLMVI